MSIEDMKNVDVRTVDRDSLVDVSQWFVRRYRQAARDMCTMFAQGTRKISIPAV